MKSTHWRKEKEQIFLVQHMNHLIKDTIIEEKFITSWFWTIEYFWRKIMGILHKHILVLWYAFKA